MNNWIIDRLLDIAEWALRMTVRLLLGVAHFIAIFFNSPSIWAWYEVTLEHADEVLAGKQGDTENGK